MIIFLIFLFPFLLPDALSQSPMALSSLSLTTFSSCVAIHDEIACKAFSSHGCEWSNYVGHCFNATSVKHCSVLINDTHDELCEKDELCSLLHSNAIAQPEDNYCVDKQSADFANKICAKLNKEECNANYLCEYYVENRLKKDGCFPYGDIYQFGIECDGLRKEKCFKNNKCILFERNYKCTEYNALTPGFFKNGCNRKVDVYTNRERYCNGINNIGCFWSERKNSCMPEFECDKITDEERCNYFEHCGWDQNVCHLVDNNFCGRFSDNQCKSKNCKWYDSVKACVSPKLHDDCRLINPEKCEESSCILIQSRKRCQGKAFTARAESSEITKGLFLYRIRIPTELLKPYCFQGKQNCHCLWKDYSCVPSDWFKDNKKDPIYRETSETLYKGNEIGLKDKILFDIEGNCFRKLPSSRKYSYGKYEEYTSAVEIQKPIFDCFKNFHDVALLPICGHPHFDTLAYCWRAYHYDNVDFEKFMDKTDRDKGKYMLILLDGCFFCNQKRNYFASSLKINTEIFQSFDATTVEKVKDEFVSIIDAEGNFMIALRIDSTKSTNLTFSIRHRCSDQMKLSFKNMVFHLEQAEKYPTRVILSRKVAIGLDNTSGNYSEVVAFNQLPGKADQ